MEKIFVSGMRDKKLKLNWNKVYGCFIKFGVVRNIMKATFQETNESKD